MMDHDDSSDATLEGVYSEYNTFSLSDFFRVLDVILQIAHQGFS